jgi:hypothetical protein
LLVGTTSVIAVLFQEVVGIVTPFKVTVPVDERKFCPVIVTGVPGAAGEGVMLAMLGCGILTVTDAVADFVASAWLVAVTVTFCSLAMLAGAV